MINSIKSFAYSLLDLVTLYKGVPRSMNGYTIRFPARWSRYYRDGYEKDTFDFFRKNAKQGDTILDIGAHIGLYCVPLSKSVGENGKVFCFEPTPTTYSILLKTIELNKCRNVTPVNAAISDKTGSITFNLTSDSGEGSNANSMVTSNRTVATMEIKAYSADDFRKENNLKIAILKIDVEGAELLALKGASDTFRIDRPLCILALHPNSIQNFGHSLKQIWDVIQQNNYKIVYNGSEMNETGFISQPDLFDVQLMPA
jgi:FkbM family methyltransferase